MTYYIIMEWMYDDSVPVAVTTNKHQADWVCAELNAANQRRPFQVVDAPSVDAYGVTAR